MTGNSVSFIIPHKGREQLLLATLQSIACQQYPVDAIEVIIVTQNDTLSGDITSLKDRFRLTIHSRPESDSISALRNFGVQQSSGDYLAFLDADVALSPNWINTMFETLAADPARVIASAMQKNSDSAPPLEKIRTALSNAETDTNVSFLPGRNLFLKRQTFEAVGGFPEHLVTCEDYYFTDRANKLGQLFYTSKASYIHLGEDRDYGEMFKKEIWRGQSNLQSISGRDIPLREIPSFIIPPGLLGLLLLAVTAIIAGYMVIATVCLILFLLPVCVYSIRLFRLCRHQVEFIDVLRFYLYYFPARAIGTIGGIFNTINTGSHHS